MTTKQLKTLKQESPPLRILLVEDNEHDAFVFKRAFKKNKVACQITHYTRAEKALEHIQTDVDSYDLVVTDYKLPGMSGLELCKELLAQKIPLPLVILTGGGTQYLAVEALKAGVSDYLIKDPEDGYLDLLSVVLPQVVQQYHDHMARKQAEAALQQYTIELQKRNDELDAFAHTVAHDLKNPLALVLGYADLLLVMSDTMDAETQKTYVSDILHSANKMNGIIEALLLLAGVRKTKVEVDPIDTGPIVAEAKHRLLALFDANENQFESPKTWPKALGYAPWVEEVWVNYISNALRHGGKPYRLELGATSEAENMIKFWVKDHGPGIAAEDQTQLFIPFTKLKRGQATRGYGLGLSIVRRIVEKLGGTVGVESQLGEGSTFWFTLPAA